MSSSSVKWMAILSLLAFLIFSGVITLQVMEYMHYRADPTLFLSQ